MSIPSAMFAIIYFDFLWKRFSSKNSLPYSNLKFHEFFTTIVCHNIVVIRVLREYIYCKRTRVVFSRESQSNTFSSTKVRRLQVHRGRCITFRLFFTGTEARTAVSRRRQEMESEKDREWTLTTESVVAYRNTGERNAGWHRRLSVVREALNKIDITTP